MLLTLSCWKTQPRPIFNALTEGRRLLAKCLDTWPHPSSRQYGAVVLSLLQKSTPKAWCFHPHASRLGWCSWDCTHPSSSSKHDEWSLYQKVIFWSHLTTWPSPLPPLDHPDSLWQTSDGPGHVLAWARALQDFNPWRCSVLLIVTLRLWSQLSSGRSSLIPHLSQDHSYSTRRDLAWSPSPKEIERHLEFLPFSNNCANSCWLLTKLFAYCPVAHPSPVQVYNFVPCVLRQLFGLAHTGEAGVWLIECVSFLQVTSSNRCN